MSSKYHITTDTALFLIEHQLNILLIQRKNKPYKNQWALPGGYLEPNETLKQSAKRELKEETNITPPHLHQIHAFGKPGRDPRGRTITIAYYGILTETKKTTPKTDAKATTFKPIKTLQTLAFDHKTILEKALTHLKKDMTNNNPKKDIKQLTPHQKQTIQQTTLHKNTEEV